MSFMSAASAFGGAAGACLFGLFIGYPACILREAGGLFVGQDEIPIFKTQAEFADGVLLVFDLDFVIPIAQHLFTKV